MMMGYMHFGVEMAKVETNAPTNNLLDRRIKREGWPPPIKKRRKSRRFSTNYWLLDDWIGNKRTGLYTVEFCSPSV